MGNAGWILMVQSQWWNAGLFSWGGADYGGLNPALGWGSSGVLCLPLIKARSAQAVGKCWIKDNGGLQVGEFR